MWRRRPSAPWACAVQVRSQCSHHPRDSEDPSRLVSVLPACPHCSSPKGSRTPLCCDCPPPGLNLFSRAVSAREILLGNQYLSLVFPFSPFQGFSGSYTFEGINEENLDSLSSFNKVLLQGCYKGIKMSLRQHLSHRFTLKATVT